MTPRKRKVVKPWIGYALIIRGRRDPNMIFDTQRDAEDWVDSEPYKIVEVEIREVKRKTRKRRAGK